MAGTKTKPNQYPEKIRAFFGSESSLREFEALSSNGERIEFLFRHPFVEQLFKKNALDIKNQGRPHGKSICESKRQRELGNQAFKAGNDEKALRFYNEAMAYAPWRGGECAEIRGEASDYANLALRAVTQKHLSFFVENAPHWLHEEDEMLGLKSRDPDMAAYLPSHYKSMVSLVKHRQDRTPGSLFWILVTSCLNLRQLHLAGYFNQGEVESSRPIELNPTNVKIKLTSDMKLIGQVLVEFLELMQYNTHGILESFGIAADDQALFSNPLRDRVPKRRIQSFGVGVFPTLALLNHSCGHNIFKYNIGKKMVVLAGRNIRQGEEITENYFPHHYYMSQIDRQIWLQEHYNFRCECKACIENWPTLKILLDFRQWGFPSRAYESSKDCFKVAEEQIKSVMDQVDQIHKSFLTQNPCLLISEAESLILKFREGFKVLDRHLQYPSKEHTQASETFISLLASIRGNRRELFSTSF